MRVHLISFFHHSAYFVQQFIAAFQEYGEAGCLLPTGSQGIVYILKFQLLLMHLQFGHFFFGQLQLVACFYQLQIFSAFIPFI